MPEPVHRSGRYMPGLDGIRAIAVLAVIAYHLGFGWASGGLLGVGVFFTLSGYLITDLLLGQWNDGQLRLGEFWLRRARRLLPALFVMLLVVTVWVSFAARSRLPDLRGEVASAVVYVNNWWQISKHMSYFAMFGPPSPLSHLWSLAIEEQFYLLWPWLLLLGVKFIPERRRTIRIRPRLAGLTLVLAIASAVEMSALYHRTFDASRIYDATDTRAFGLLFGAALAMVWPSRSLTTRVTPTARSVLDGVGLVGLVTMLALFWRTDQYSSFLYQGGIVLLSIATVLAVGACAHPATRVGHALGSQPLRWIGVRSYGIYLWHEPIIVLTTPASAHGVNLGTAAAQIAATLVIATLSWRFVEEPIRRGALRRFWRHLRSRSPSRRTRVAARAGLVAGVGILMLASVGLAGVRPSAFPHSKTRHELAFSAPVSAQRASSSYAKTRAEPGARERLRTSCRSVVHIGDSTSSGLISSNYLPDPGQRMDAQYARVGVTHSHFVITPATSIVETLPGGTDAEKVATGLVKGGYRGCWVLALGTNDAADVFVGSKVSLGDRIKQMMSAIGSEPVLWVNVKSLVGNGPYAEKNMERWNQALVEACPVYPNMRIYDWTSVVQDRWFIPDGIHYYSPGYAARAHLIANALTRAFPARGQPPIACTVHTRSVNVPVRGVR